MPARQNRKTIPTVALQGEDSYVVLRRYEHGEMKVTGKRARELQAAYDAALAKAKKDKTPEPEPPDLTGLSLASMGEHIVDWNWVNDEGKPLPLPKDDPTVWDRLTHDEIDWLEKTLMGPSEADLKN